MLPSRALSATAAESKTGHEPESAASPAGESAASIDSPAGDLQPPRQPPGLRRLAGLLPALALLLVAVWEIWASVRVGAAGDVPGAAAWEQARATVRERFRPGDLIVFAPRWIDPVGRRHLGDLIPVDTAARMDDARFGTVWELSIRGAEAAESRGRTASFSAEHGGVRVRRLESDSGPAVVLTDFVAALPRAEISGPAVQMPASRLEEVGFAPHRCVRVEPRPDQTVRIRYPGVVLGRALVGYVGLADVFTRRDIRDPGRLEVSVNGATVASVEVGVDDGWVRFAVATEPEQAAEVVFAATAVGARARKRLICFAAEARE